MIKKFDKIIKLDSDVEIKVKSTVEKESEVLEKVYDSEKKMYYYKVWFSEEFQ